MVIFIYNESETTTWMGIASEPKAQNPKQKTIFFESQAVDH